MAIHICNKYASVSSNLRKLAKNKKLNPQARRARSISRPGIQAKTVAKRHVIKVVHQMRKSSEHSKPREQTQTQVPHSHRSAPVPRRTITHCVLSQNDQKSVSNDREHGQHRVFTHPLQDRDWIIFGFEPTR
jgi:hypothetical protein